MKIIIVGFSKPIKPTCFSRLISFLEKTEYDHVYIKWNWLAVNRDIIYQASKLAVNFESNLTFNSHALTLEEYEITISDSCHKEIMQFCMDNSNKPYGIKEVFGFLWVKICASMNIVVHNPFPTYGHSFVCSKIAADVVEKAGIELNASPDDIYPSLLNEILNKAKIKRIK